MKMNAEASVNFPPLAAQFIAPDSLLREMGSAAVLAIQTRTRAGRPLEGEWAPYSRGYAKMRAEIGKPDRVNLEFSGAMLNALTYRTVGGAVRAVDIGFAGDLA